MLAPEPPVEDWITELDAWVTRSKGFFNDRPVVLDLSKLSLSKPDVAGLLAQLQARSMRIISVEGVDPSWLGTGLAPLPGSGKAGHPVTIATEESAETSSHNANGPVECNSLLLDSPVRSGQSIVFPNGDVTVMGSVASGAEVIAGGSIHIYGTLRGRAIAGSTGNAKARIFAQKFDAELLVIDGLYKTADEIVPHLRGQPVQAWLAGDAMMMTALD